ncbi:MAG: phosphoribosylanthranilate isomerase [Lysobacteraceae bacterium]|nr:phosphoribosylanthranilate isomerase [Xanthomonadales bacterium]HPF72281.1 phosphoribosylanthranilate isomerase [Xanthomonadaceae bacterium]HRX98578.1 phosphoribosylanthranilate isomerase [Xanthomonadaceae bacterium]
MSRTRIKFCGMTRRGDIDVAAALGVDAIGLIIAERSVRRLTPEQAAQLVEGLPPLLSKVLLCMDNEPALIREAIDAAAPQWLQFHGRETAAECEAFGLPYLKAVPMGSLADAAAFTGYIARFPGAAGFVLDSHASGKAGGSGERFDWSRTPHLSRPWLLAGGLTPDNVAQAIRATRPFAVDVSSGIESAPGTKDQQRMRHFVAEVCRAGGNRSDRENEQDQ